MFLDMRKHNDMYHAFHEIGSTYNHSKSRINDLLRVMPESLKVLDTFVGSSGQGIVYKFGNPIQNLKDNGIAIGGSQAVPLEALYICLDIATRYFDQKSLEICRSRLAEEAKHHEQIAEFRPFVDISEFDSLEYEVPGNGKKTVDWRLRSGRRKVLFDVKVRWSTIVSNLNDMISRNGDRSRELVMPKTDAVKLFKSVQDKFNEISGDDELQGAWLFTMSMENRTVVEQYFHEVLDPQKVNFCIISGWGNRFSILTRNDNDKSFLEKQFGLYDGNSMLYD